MYTLRPYVNRKNAVSRYNPFMDLDEFENSLFGDIFRGSKLSEFNTDIRDCGDHFTLESDLPGFAKEDIKLDIENDTLTISAVRHSEHEDKDKKGNYLRCERTYGSYSRSFDVSGIDQAAIKAKYADGVLTLTLPKKQPEKEQSRQLVIE